MNRDTIAAIPLRDSYLCADLECSTVSNCSDNCPICHSIVFSLASVLNRTTAADPEPAAPQANPESREGPLEPALEQCQSERGTVEFPRSTDQALLRIGVIGSPDGMLSKLLRARAQESLLSPVAPDTSSSSPGCSQNKSEPGTEEGLRGIS